MPIILDFSQVAISGVQSNLGKNAKRGNPQAKPLIKHMILNSILFYKKKWGHTHGEVIIATDSRVGYWRTEVFKYYKAHRKKNREESDIDWPFIYEVLNEVLQDLRDVFPYKVINVDKAEGDDVIACLTKYFQTNELVQDGVFMQEPQKVLIGSSDGDFPQLQKYPNVSQWSSKVKKMLKPAPTLAEFRMEHICTGDAGDGVPNICSPDNAFVDHIRQSPFKKARLADFVRLGEDACLNDTERRNFHRNQRMVDFDFIPPEIYNNVVAEYESQKPTRNKTKIMNYMIKNQMKLLMESIGEF